MDQVELMSDAVMYALIVGALTPLLVSVIEQPKWRSGIKAVVGALIAVVLGAGTAYFADAFQGRGIVSSILIVLAVSLTSYQGFWKQIGVTGKIESATSPTPKRAHPDSEPNGNTGTGVL